MSSLEFGRVLKIDLSTEAVKVYDIARDDMRKFIGGEGIAAKIYWDEVPPNINAFDENNILIFATGPLVASGAPGAGRTIVAGRSPQSYPEGYTISSFGGEWGAELRYAGYDILVIKGKAKKPVYIWIKDEDVEIRSASHLWGKDTFTVRENIIREVNDEEAKIITIGPAGEKRVRYAPIIHRSGHAAGQGGFGAVMGSKNLKAIAVRGTRRIIKVHDPDGLLALVERVKKIATLMGVTTEESPLCEGYKKVGTPVVSELVPFIEKYKLRNTGCHDCPKGCHVFLEVPELGGGEMTCVQFFYCWLQLGAKGEVDEACFLAKQLADKYGVNVYELLQLIPYILVLNEKGVLSEEETGIPFSKFPGKEFIETLILKIANREGIGDLLAEGTWRFAEKLGRLKEYLTMEGIEESLANKFGMVAGYMGYGTGGHGYCAHYDPRDFIVSGILWATGHRDPWSYSHEYIAVVEWSGLDFEYQQKIAEIAWGSKDAIHPMGDPKYDEHEVRAAIIVQNRSVIKNSLPLCDWIYPILCTPYTEAYIGDIEMASKLFTAVTGIKMTEQELLKIGERIFNLERAILVREGRRREGDTLPDYVFLYPHRWTGSPPLDREKFEKVMDMYYSMRGWDVKTGIPKEEKLKELGLEDVARKLREEGLLPG